MNIGKRIRQLRSQRGLSQAAVERRTGLLRSYISRVEHGHTVPSPETLERLAKALGVPVGQLLNARDRMALKTSKGRPKSQMSDDARLVFGTLAEDFSKL